MPFWQSDSSAVSSATKINRFKMIVMNLVKINVPNILKTTKSFCLGCVSIKSRKKLFKILLVGMCVCLKK